MGKIRICDFWGLLTSDDAAERERGYEMSCEHAVENPEYLQTVREILSPSAYEIYDGAGHLHDFGLAKINFEAGAVGKVDAEIVLYDMYDECDKGKFVKASYRNIREYRMNVPKTAYRLMWMRDIFEIVGGLITHRIIFCDNMAVDVTCESVDIVACDEI